MRRIQRNLHIGNSNGIVSDAFLRRTDSALIVQEEDIICLLEYRIQINNTGAADRSSDLIEVTRISILKCCYILGIRPAQEFAAGFFRGRRCIDNLIIFYFLCITRKHVSCCIIEMISSDCRTILA